MVSTYINDFKHIERILMTLSMRLTLVSFATKKIQIFSVYFYMCIEMVQNIVIIFLMGKYCLRIINKGKKNACVILNSYVF